ncbi:SAM-dependent methyltransferase [Neisseriaceae bacterium B2N2-7]|uniref:SAM-dependent methyltransferase n=1 Tax=Craterilacuibacter sinensis TaxID=2686017 RepID=A0A845BMZ3_9NEIS|nr:SAM-dependent methyltransferase [Craterilacuibacter sinensis]
MKISPLQFNHIVKVLDQMLRFESPSDVILSNWFREHRQLGSTDRHAIAEACFTCLRRLETLRALCAPKKPNSRNVLLAAMAKLWGTNLKECGDGLKEDEKIWLADVKGRAMPDGLAQRAELPQWVIDRMSDQDEDSILELGRGLMQSAPLDLRVNTLKGRRDEVLSRLIADGFDATVTPYSPLGIRLKGKPAINKHILFMQGVIEVQDEGSQLLGLITGARRSEMVVDFCAGAGGKTMLLGAQMHNSGRLYAFDVSEKRLSNLKPRLARSGLSNVHPTLIAHENDTRVKRLAGKAQRVLVDAPCSGMGTLRRNPDLKYRQSPDSVAELNVKQASILASASRMVAVGGRLVYATCSLLPQENMEIVNAFLAAHPDFSLVPASAVLAEMKIPLDTGDVLQLNPAIHQTDGFFAAVMTRNAATAAE